MARVKKRAFDECLVGCLGYHHQIFFFKEVAFF